MLFDRKHHLLVFICFIIGGFIFYYIPAVDLKTSAWFYNDAHKFYLAHEPIVVFIHKAVPVIATLFVLSIFAWVALIFLRTRSFELRHYLVAIYLFACCALGPGVMVHYVFKDYFQRARPVQSQQFGGEHEFTPAFVVSGQCVHNCSFVSGHASVGFMFFSLAFIPQFVAYRRRIFIGASVLGALFGIGRIIEGGHFLSDIVFAGFVVYFTCYYLAVFFVKKLKMKNTL